MDAKCPKCEGTQFSIKKRDDKVYCYVTCSECGSVVGVLEDIDFRAHNNNVINNFGNIDRKINSLEDEIENLRRQNNQLLEYAENIFNIVRKLR